MNTTNKVDWAAEVQQAVLAMKEEGQKAYTFMKQEAPEVAAEYVAWKRAQSLISLTPYAVGIPVLAMIIVWFVRVSRVQEDPVDRVGFRILAGMFGFFLIMTALSSSRDIAAATKPWMAPRITILEGIKEVVR